MFVFSFEANFMQMSNHFFASKFFSRPKLFRFLPEPISPIPVSVRAAIGLGFFKCFFIPALNNECVFFVQPIDQKRPKTRITNDVGSCRKISSQRFTFLAPNSIPGDCTGMTRVARNAFVWISNNCEWRTNLHQGWGAAMWV